jgi:hypothetical protein
MSDGIIMPQLSIFIFWPSNHSEKMQETGKLSYLKIVMTQMHHRQSHSRDVLQNAVATVSLCIDIGQKLKLSKRETRLRRQHKN